MGCGRELLGAGRGVPDAQLPVALLAAAVQTLALPGGGGEHVVPLVHRVPVGRAHGDDLYALQAARAVLAEHSDARHRRARRRPPSAHLPDRLLRHAADVGAQRLLSGGARLQHRGAEPAAADALLLEVAQMEARRVRHPSAVHPANPRHPRLQQPRALPHVPHVDTQHQSAGRRCARAINAHAGRRADSPARSFHACRRRLYDGALRDADAGGAHHTSALRQPSDGRRSARAEDPQTPAISELRDPL